ncbi:NAD(P)-dependent dehydrogenase, short-chain alcohol dehydrogenase family [Microlunatus sagamiharensis]|uniref:NAD(P)-dependent dehydrogenase, short-chain alcohol dehydrogenase family n=1 Tax=Microlunatus sagamiharensis TaxID=546874 RepID=A0A1H2MNU8_9ACTN|nr:SDR family oxidoreductase [Microlunatus sagamiharensis]SDU94772.1 NAD(P)-dependent dehydrogenase, short-chain alcohol dehydrogenase family [Microlunatus sagamiharensis]
MSTPTAERVVLVTGGSRGIGRAAVQALHREGAHVVLHHRASAEAADRLAEELGSASEEGRVHVVAADLAQPGEPARLWEQALAWRGHVDVLVNNAGIYLASPMDDDDAWTSGWADNLTVNLLAPAELCRLAVRTWREAGTGGIVVNVTSRAAHRGDDADHLAYGAAKGGLQSLTKGIARAFAGDRILAYDVAPGWVLTDMMAETDAAALAASMPMGEITPPEDVAEVIAFLASGRVPHTSGATIDVTGADYVR